MSPEIDLAGVLGIPTAETLTKTGVVLYLSGVLCTFLYFSRFHILSLDFLQPQAILLGIYLWFLGVAVPRLLMLVIYHANSFGVRRAKWPVMIVFVTLLAGLYSLIFAVVLESSWIARIVSGVVMSLLAFVFHVDYGRRALAIQPSNRRLALFLPLLCVAGSYLVFPKLPGHLGGFQPSAVTVVLKEATLLNNRFSRYTYLLYESGSAFYFFEKRVDSGTQTVLNYEIMRIEKSQVLKIQTATNLWQPF